MTYPWSPQDVVAEPKPLRPGAPAEEVAGPPLTALVYELGRASQALHMLAGQAKLEARERLVLPRTQMQVDVAGNGAVEIFTVPQGATGYLLWCAIEVDGSTPAVPSTAAAMWHAIYAAESSGMSNPTQIIARGNLLDLSPNDPAVDAQLPFAYRYAQKYSCPTLFGPQSFYFVAQGVAGAAVRAVSVRAAVLLEQPEP